MRINERRVNNLSAILKQEDRMKTTIQLSIIFFLGIFATAAFSQDKSASLFNEKFKIIEGHQKNLDENYQNKLKDLDTEFKLKSKMVDNKLKEINTQRENIEKTLVTELYVVDTRMSRTEWQLNFIWGFFGLASIAGIIALFVIYMKVRDYAETKVKEKFDEHFEKEFEKRFQAKEDDIKKLLRLHNEELQLRNQKIMVLSKQDADTAFLQKYFKKVKLEKTDFQTFDLNQKYVETDLILFNDQDKEHQYDVNEIINYAKTVPEKTMCFYFGSQRIPAAELGDNFTFANIKMQLYGNLMSALRYSTTLNF